MRSTTKLALATVPVLALAAGCAREGVHAAEPQEVKRVSPAAVQGPYVPAGTQFAVSMQDTVGTQTSYEGTPFTATVVRPLLAGDGSVVVPQGATVHGRVANVDSGMSPVLLLDFDTIETQWGDAPISAKLQDAQKVTFPGNDEVYDPAYGYDDYGYYDAAFYSPGIGTYPYYGGYYGGVTPYYQPIGFYDYNAREIRVPAGATLQLELTRPILPPGSEVQQQPGAQPRREAY